MPSDLNINRGLFKNTINVDGEDYKVNEGYLTPLTIGFGVGALSDAIFSKSNNKVKSALIAGSLGAATLAGIAEIKRFKINKILNEDKESGMSLAKKGFNIKARISDRPSFVPTMLLDLAKTSSLNESKMIRKLDQTEDDANAASSIIETSAIVGLSSGLYSNKPKDILDKGIPKILGKLNVINAAMADKDDKMSDLLAAAQFFAYTPRMINGAIRLIHGGKSNILQNSIGVASDYLHGTAPIAARFLKKSYSDT